MIILKNSTKNALLNSPLFQNTEQHAAALLECEGVTERDFKKGDIIFDENDFSRSLGIITRGSAIVEKVCGDKRIIMSTLEKSAIFGMPTLFGKGEKFPTVITAEKDCTAVFLSKDWVTAAFAAEPQITENYITLLSDKIRFLTDKIDSLSAKRGTSKLYAYIVDEYDKRGENGKVTLKYNMSELSRVLGIGRTTLYRELDELVNENIIIKKGKTIILR